MRVMHGWILFLSLAAGFAVAAEEYYQMDPLKMAALQASRCAAYQKESGLIRKRLTSPMNRQGDVDRMKTKLQSLEGLMAKNCPTDTKR